MMMEEGRDKSQTDFQLRRLSLIDFSSENDALVFGNSSPLQGQIAETDMQQGLFESFGESFGSGKEIDLSLTPDGVEEDQCPDLKKSSEPDRFSWKGKCNLRKSLAWDSAFFTSAGVLDAEELSCMIKGAEKSGKKLLPGIEEDIRESSDSLSTLESDNLALENLEAELFQDIRASIQRSSKSFAASSEQANPVGSKTIPSKKKMNSSSQNQKPTPDLKKPTGASKPLARQTPRAQGIAVNQDARRPKVEQVKAVRPGNSNPTLKPPRVISTFKPTTIPIAKRASFAASDVKKTGLHNTTGSAADKLPPASKAPVVSIARRVLPRPTLPSRTSSFGFSNSTKSASSSLDSSGSVSTEKISKSNLLPTQRKVGGKTANPPPAPSSSLKTPSKSASRNTTTSRNSAVSAYLMSSKISSSMSPASSNNELSSASSSSSVTFNLGSKSRTSFDTSSCRSSQNDSMTSDWNGHYSSQMLDKGENERITVPSRSARKSSTQTGTLSCSESARPSGLRLPSPKIGFFDGAKSVRTPNGLRQSQSNPAMLPKTGAAVLSPRRSSSVKPKSVKTSHTKAVSALPKRNSQELTSPMPIEKAQTPQEPDHSDVSDVRGHSISFYLDLKYDEESHEKVEEVRDEVPVQANHVETSSIGVIINEDDLSLMRKNETNPDVNRAVNPKGNKAVAIGDLHGCDSEKREILKPWEKVDEVDKAIGGVSLVDAAISSKDNMVAAIGDSSNSEKREISKPLDNVDGPENFGMLSVSVTSIAEKENVVLREHVDEFGSIPGH